MRTAVDSAATKSVTPDARELTELKTLHGQTALAANNTTIPIPGEGNMEYAKDMKVEGVLHCPSVRQNLQSVAQTTDQHDIAVHMDRNVLIWHKTKLVIPPEDIIATGTKVAGMYLLDEVTNLNVSSTRVNCETIHELDETRGVVKTEKLAIRDPDFPIYERIGIYNFEVGDGIIKEPLSVLELPEKPIPRPVIRKRKKERWDPM